MTALEWSYKGVEGIFREGEEVIAKDVVQSYYYALEIWKGRFRAGEEAMTVVGDRWARCWYVDYVKFLKDRGIEI